MKYNSAFTCNAQTQKMHLLIELQYIYLNNINNIGSRILSFQICPPYLDENENRKQTL